MTLRIAAIIAAIVGTLFVIGFVITIILLLTLNPAERAIVDSLQFIE